ncbi:uncharacterized protein TNIN_209281 [Trichonephila inaurata madagascariensis]|uniref:PAN domain protein n=1 Tax=Trichonephila inaurata madagascariensis TaxID=2747483 RepID=A0A8X6X9Q8_9ARAC|nr:uncharacterized protein TNIN_209281 [Trichonephila inaurata madagascariensis]
MLTEKITTGESIEDCRQQCYDTKEFICRSVTFDRRFKTCGLSHHTRKSAPPESITRSDSHELLEISTCFQVSVDCRQDIMMANVKSNALFKGKVYAKGKPMTCSTDISNSVEFSLPISLNSPECGTVSEITICFKSPLLHYHQSYLSYRKLECPFLIRETQGIT